MNMMVIKCTNDSPWHCFAENWEVSVFGKTIAAIGSKCSHDAECLKFGHMTTEVARLLEL